MKDKEMIEEMASIICESTSNRGTCNECGFKRHEQYGFIYQCHNFDSAEKIYNAVYRKIPEGSVVLSKEEYEELEELRLNHAKDLINANELYEERIADLKIEFDNHIKNLEEKIDMRDRDLNSQANRLIDLKEKLKQARKETAEKILQEILLMVSCWDGRNVHINHDELVEFGKKYDVDLRVVEE